VECTGAKRDASGAVLEVQAKGLPDTKSGTPGADAVKVKGNISWVGVADGVKAEVRLYDRLFSVPQPGAGEKDFPEELNPESLKVGTAYVQPLLGSGKGDEEFPVGRRGDFCGGGRGWVGKGGGGHCRPRTGRRREARRRVRSSIPQAST